MGILYNANDCNNYVVCPHRSVSLPKDEESVDGKSRSKEKLRATTSDAQQAKQKRRYLNFFLVDWGRGYEE